MKNMLKKIKDNWTNIALVLIIIGLLLTLPRFSTSGEINLQMEFAYNGSIESTEGFNFYQEDSSGAEVKIVQIVGSSIRSWDGIVQIETGRSLFYLTAYGDGWESNRSNAYPFEYIEPDTPGNPPPTIIIRFN